MAESATLESTTTETPLPSAPSDDLWTSDSERHADTAETADVAPPVVAEAAEPAQPETPEQIDARARDEAGKFANRGKPRSDPRARVEQATRTAAEAKEEARLANEKAARLEAELAVARRPAEREPQRQSQTTNGLEPTRAKPSEDAIGTTYQSYAEFVEDLNDWKDEQRQAKANYDTAVKSHQDSVRAYSQRETAFKATHPDYDQRIQATAHILLPPVMHQAILTSERSAELAYYLATHPEDYAQLVSESMDTPVVAAPVMRRFLEAQLTTGAAARPDSASVVRPSTAKAPINRVGGTANATPVDPDDLDFGPDYIKAENAREKRQREASRW